MWSEDDRQKIDDAMGLPNARTRAIRELSDAATPGTWRWSRPRNFDSGGIWHVESTANILTTPNASDADLAFIVTAVNFVRDWLAIQPVADETTAEEAT